MKLLKSSQGRYLLLLFLLVCVSILVPLRLHHRIISIPASSHQGLSNMPILSMQSSLFGGRKKQTQKQVGGAIFREFHASAEQHNRTVNGQSLPGAFSYGSKLQLYLLGTRLTTSYELHDDSVYATLFALPGQTIRLRKRRCSNDTHLLDFNNITTMYDMYCLVDQVVDDNGHCDSSSSPSSANHNNCKAIKMEHIPTISNDGNQDNITVIWNGNISKWIRRGDLIRNSGDLYKSEKAVRLVFWLVPKTENEFDESTFSPATNKTKALARVDIPLSTGVAGHAGPQIRSSLTLSPSFFVQPPISATLCVAM
jgi:hypothetical protein